MAELTTILYYVFLALSGAVILYFSVAAYRHHKEAEVLLVESTRLLEASREMEQESARDLRFAKITYQEAQEHLDHVKDLRERAETRYGRREG